jgi:hypothetical protein
LAFQLGQLWLSVWESIRVRNGHVCAFWVVALSLHRFPRAAVVNAAAFASTMLGAMFIEVFLHNALGFAMIVAVSLGMVTGARFVDRRWEISPSGLR